MQGSHVEVDDEPETHLQEFQMRDDLGSMNRKDFGYRFDLDHHQLSYEKI
jgi:hypothetical protein